MVIVHVTDYVKAVKQTWIYQHLYVWIIKNDGMYNFYTLTDFITCDGVLFRIVIDFNMATHKLESGNIYSIANLVHSKLFMKPFLISRNKFHNLFFI